MELEIVVIIGVDNQGCLAEWASLRGGEVIGEESQGSKRKQGNLIRVRRKLILSGSLVSDEVSKHPSPYASNRCKPCNLTLPRLLFNASIDPFHSSYSSIRGMLTSGRGGARKILTGVVCSGML